MSTMPKLLHIAAVGIAGLGLLLVIIGVAIPYWLHQETNNIENYLGLWKQCTKAPSIDLFCQSTDVLIDALKLIDTDFITPTRGLEIFGLLVLAGAIVIGVIHMLVLKETELLYLVEAGISIGAGVFMLIGATVFAVMRNDSKLNDAYKLLDLHAGFALCIVAAILSVVAGVLFVVAKGQQ